MSSISINTESGEMKAFHAPSSKGAQSPAIVMLQEIFGVNESMRQVASEFADEGYHVIVPDLFWRQEPGVELDPSKEADRELAAGYMKGLAPELALADIRASIETVRNLKEGSGKVGVVGFCLGGRLAYMAAAATTADASVAYYGVGLDGVLGVMAEMRAPLLIHIGREDHLCPPEAQEKIVTEAGRHPNIHAHVYEGASHGFRRPNSPNNNAAAAKLADERTLNFLKKHLS